MSINILPCKCGEKPTVFNGYTLIGECNAIVWLVSCDACGREAYHPIEGFARAAWNNLHGEEEMA